MRRTLHTIGSSLLGIVRNLSGSKWAMNVGRGAYAFGHPDGTLSCFQQMLVLTHPQVQRPHSHLVRRDTAQNRSKTAQCVPAPLLARVGPIGGHAPGPCTPPPPSLSGRDVACHRGSRCRSRRRPCVAKPRPLRPVPPPMASGSLQMCQVVRLWHGCSKGRVGSNLRPPLLPERCTKIPKTKLPPSSALCGVRRRAHDGLQSLSLQGRRTSSVTPFLQPTPQRL